MSSRWIGGGSSTRTTSNPVALRRGDFDGGALVLKRYRHPYPGEARAAVAAIDRLVAGDEVAAAAEGGEK